METSDRHRKFISKVKEITGCSHEIAMELLGYHCELTMQIHNEQYSKGYNEGYDQCTKKRNHNIRYVIDFSSGMKKLYKTADLNHKDYIDIPYSDDTVFVNILERTKAYHDLDLIKIKLFYSDGTTIEGWYLDWIDVIGLADRKLLFDGRFNQ